MQDCDPWWRGNKRSDFLTGGTFPNHDASWGEASGLTELRIHNLKFKVVELNGIYSKRGNFKRRYSRNLHNFSCLRLKSMLWMHKVRLLKATQKTMTEILSLHRAKTHLSSNQSEGRDLTEPWYSLFHYTQERPYLWKSGCSSSKIKAWFALTKFKSKIWTCHVNPQIN